MINFILQIEKLNLFCNLMSENIKMVSLYSQENEEPNIYDKNTLNIINDIVKEKKKELLIPICGGMAYISGEIKNKEDCLIHIGSDFFIKKNLSKVNDIVKRRIENNKKSDITKLDDNTYEIKEHYQSASILEDKFLKKRQIEDKYRKKDKEERKDEDKEEELKRKAKEKEIIKINREKMADINNIFSYNENIEEKTNELKILPAKDILYNLIKREKEGK